MKNWISWNFLLFLGVLSPINESAHTPVVSTKTGNIRGTRKYSNGRCLDVYYGIPFAKPPVGDLRFKTTVPVEKWSGILNATIKPPACPQVPLGMESRDTESAESEDCLYLNIWAPCSKRKKAVMFWIYGGSFIQGSGSRSLYDGSELATREDVIIVTMNYRMTIFGFATSNTEDAPGNAGMYDQVEALKWVHDNIENFRGNASCITLFGESAGSISVSMHTVSPLTQNLFHRAITESGSAFLLIIANTPAANLNITDAIAKAVNCSTSVNNIETQPQAVIDCMRKIDVETLIKYSSDYQFLPQYGDSFMPEDPKIEIMNGKSKNCDRLMGVVADEGSLFWAREFLSTYGMYGEKVQHPILSKTQARPMMNQILFQYGIPPVVSQPVIEYYLSKVQGDNNEEVLKQAYTALGDNVFDCPSVYEAEEVSQQGNNVYFYQFSHRTTYINTGEWTGVTHFTEVPYVFGDPLRQNKAGTEMQYTKEEKKLSRKVIRMWTNFAKTGSPAYANIFWPPFSEKQPSYYVLNTTKRSEIGLGPHRDNCNFLRRFYL